jgi:hypothetical protein
VIFTQASANAVAPENIPALLVRDEVFQAVMSALNSVASINIESMLTTSLVSQPMMSLLNADAPENISSIEVTWNTFHRVKSALKFDLSLKAAVISLTRETFHIDMSPCSFSSPHLPSVGATARHLEMSPENDSSVMGGASSEDWSILRLPVEHDSNTPELHLKQGAPEFWYIRDE